MSPGERPTEPLASVSLEVGPFSQRVSTLVSRGEAGGTWALIYGPSRTPLVLRSAMKGDELQPTLETVRRALSEVPPPPAT